MGLHVGPDTVPAILRAFDFWATNPLSTQKMLQKHECLHYDENPVMSDLRSLPGASTHLQNTINQNMAQEREEIKETLQEREEIKETLLSMPDDELRKCLPSTLPLPYFRAHPDEFHDIFHAISTGDPLAYEEMLYRTTKVFIPPKKLRSRHPHLHLAAKRLMREGLCTRDNRVSGSATYPRRRSTCLTCSSRLTNKWSATGSLTSPLSSVIQYVLFGNAELISQLQDSSFSSIRLFPTGDGYPDLRRDVFETIRILEMFARRHEPDAEHSVGVKDGVELFATDVCEMFFGEAAAAVKVMKGRITLEFICGGVSEELAKIRFDEESTRPKDFPRTFTRMWLSNVPYVSHLASHG